MYAIRSYYVHGRLIKRYKRFLSDICLDDNSVVIAHCTNTGSMKSCIEEGAEVYLSPALDPKRKTQFTWEMIKINGHWIGINTLIPNALAYEAVVNNSIPLLSGYTYVHVITSYSIHYTKLYDCKYAILGVATKLFGRWSNLILCF